MERSEKCEFSIIIPAYNVEKYIGSCIESILQQSFSDFEILIINDGSTDGTLTAAEAFAEKDPRIRLFSKKNAGLSHTRNYGMEKAVGKFLYFVDSDDLLEKDALLYIEKQIQCNPEADIIATRYRVMDDKTGDKEKVNDFPEKVLSDGTEMSAAEQYMACFLYDDISTMAQLYVVRREYLNSLGLRFCEGIFHEDELWTPQLFLNAERIAYCRESCYLYRVNRAGAITSAFSDKHYKDRMFVMDRLHELADAAEDATVGRAYRERIACLYAGFIQNIAEICGRKEILSGLSDRRYYLKGAVQRKYRFLYFAVVLLGVRNALKLFSLLMHMRGAL